jgi:hypothetical protein
MIQTRPTIRKVIVTGKNQAGLPSLFFATFTESGTAGAVGRLRSFGVFFSFSDIAQFYYERGLSKLVLNPYGQDIGFR